MALQVKTSHFVNTDPERVLELLEERESDNAGISIDVESEMDR